MSDTETLDGGRSSPTHGGRHEKSLGLLTSKFVDLLQAAEGGVLDLKKVRITGCILLVHFCITVFNILSSIFPEVLDMHECSSLRYMQLGS